MRASVTISRPCEARCHGTVVGGGVIIGRRDDGSLVVATARHLARSVTLLRVSLYAGERTDDATAFPHRATAWREAELLTTSGTSDLALLLVPASPTDAIAVAPFALDPVTQSGSIVGAPYGKTWSISRYQYVSADTAGSFLIDCATCGPGDSGGGAFDARGRLAGMLVSEQRVIEGGRAVPAPRTMRFRVIAVSEIRSLLRASRRMSAPRSAPLIDPWSRFPVPQTH